MKRITPEVAVTAGLLAASLLAPPASQAEPGIWPDCNPNIPEAMAECAMPPKEPCGQN
jgi:hypothetical protein